MAGEPTPSRTMDDVTLLLGRVALGLIFVQNGLQQLMALDAFAAQLASRGLPLPLAGAGIGVALEVSCGLLIVSGFSTRVATPPIILFMIVATLTAHRYWELAEGARRGQEIQFFKNISIIGGLLLLSVAGPGRFSFDALFRRK